MIDRGRGAALTGSLLALVGTLSFAPITTFASLSYKAGADGPTLVAIRYLAAVVIFWLLLLLRGRLPLLPRRAWGNALAAGICWIGGTYGYMGSVQYIPVSLAAVTIYCFPLLVAAMAPLTEKARLSKGHVLAFLVAFGGLAWAIGPSFEALDWRGLALAALGAVGSAGMLLLTGRLDKSIDSMAHTFWVNVVGLIGVGALVMSFGGPRLPGTSDGWWSLIAVILCYLAAILMVLGGAKLAGAARTAMIMNLEPVITLVLAYFVLQETLGLDQLGGASLVIGSIVFVGWLDLRRQSSNPKSRRSDATLGVLLAFGAAVIYSSITSLAAYAYRDGGNPQTLLICRFLLTAVTLGIAGAMAGRVFGVGRSTLWAILGGGVGLFAMSTGYMTSVAFIPVALAALIFYVFPLLVAGGEAVVDRKPIGMLKALAYLLAFGGLGMALGPDFEGLDWRGMVFAGCGAVAAVLMFLSTRRLTRAVDSQVATFYLSLIASALAVATLPLQGEIAFPDTLLGLGALVGACVCFLAGMLLHVAAIKVAGPARTAMILNFEPALTVLIAAVFLGELLSLTQWGGVALVLAALAMSSLPGKGVQN